MRPRASRGIRFDTCPSNITIHNNILQEAEIPDVAKASQKWAESWGPDVARALSEYVGEIMPDYEYLYQNRLRSSSL